MIWVFSHRYPLRHYRSAENPEGSRCIRPYGPDRRKLESARTILPGHRFNTAALIEVLIDQSELAIFRARPVAAASVARCMRERGMSQTVTDTAFRFRGGNGCYAVYAPPRDRSSLEFSDSCLRLLLIYECIFSWEVMRKYANLRRESVAAL